MASLRDLIAAVTGRSRKPEPAPQPRLELPRVPTGDDLLASVAAIESEYRLLQGEASGVPALGR